MLHKKAGSCLSFRLTTTRDEQIIRGAPDVDTDVGSGKEAA
jgi:hypothetical protein